MHEILIDNLEDFLEDRLPQATGRQVQAHLDSCPECRAMLAEITESSAMLQTLAAPFEDPAPEPLPGFYAAVRQGIQERRAATPWWAFFPAIRQFATASLMLAVLLGGYAFAVQATSESAASAELLLDSPVENDAPALLSAHRHTDPNEMCRLCWSRIHRAETHHNAGFQRDSALVAIAQGD